MELPTEMKKPGKIWKLVKACYGLWDGSRKWFLEVEEQLLKSGCKKSTKDEAFYYYHNEGQLQGLVCVHVDDFFMTGNAEFKKEIRDRLIQKFEFGKCDQENFKFTGINFRTVNKDILIDQQDFIDKMQLTEIDPNTENDDKLTKEKMKTLRSMTGKVQWAQNGTRPDLSYDGVEMSTKNKVATIADLKAANKTIKKANREEVEIKYKRLGDLKNLHIKGYSDASFN